MARGELTDADRPLLGAVSSGAGCSCTMASKASLLRATVLHDLLPQLDAPCIPCGQACMTHMTCYLTGVTFAWSDIEKQYGRLRTEMSVTVGISAVLACCWRVGCFDCV